MKVFLLGHYSYMFYEQAFAFIIFCKADIIILQLIFMTFTYIYLTLKTMFFIGNIIYEINRLFTGLPNVAIMQIRYIVWWYFMRSIFNNSTHLIILIILYFSKLYIEYIIFRLNTGLHKIFHINYRK